MGRCGAQGAFAALNLFRAFRQVRGLGLCRRVQLGLLRSEVRLLRLPLLAFLRLLGVELFRGMIELGIPCIQVLFAPNEGHCLGGQFGEPGLRLVFLRFKFPGSGLQVLGFRPDVGFLGSDGLFSNRHLLCLRPQRVLERGSVALDSVSFRPELRLFDREGLADRLGFGPDACGFGLIPVLELCEFELMRFELLPGLLDSCAFLLQPVLVRSKGFLRRDDPAIPLGEVACLGLQVLRILLKVGVHLVDPLGLGHPILL